MNGPTGQVLGAPTPREVPSMSHSMNAIDEGLLALDNQRERLRDVVGQLHPTVGNELQEAATVRDSSTAPPPPGVNIRLAGQAHQLMRVCQKIEVLLTQLNALI